MHGPAIVSTRGFGQTQEVFSHPAIVTCPPCSYFVEGTCIVCPNGDPHPACNGCVNGMVPPPAWYERDLVITVGVGLITSITAAIMITQLRRLIKQPKLF